MNKKDSNCLTGACPVLPETGDTVKMSEGSGGVEMQLLVDEIKKHFEIESGWSGTSDDSASIHIKEGELVFTTDSYVVTPTFFPGGDIGKIAFCGTVNDLSMMGAKPLGISLGLILEEGLSKKELFDIVSSISDMSKETGIPIVTGDTKVLEKGAIDKIVINSSGVGTTQSLLIEQLKEGDDVIVSGGVGEHGTALLAKRYDLETDVVSDSKPLHREIEEIKGLVKQAKDVTRGGLAAILNEMTDKNNVGMLIEEKSVPLQDQVRALTEILGIDFYSLACEGRFVCIAKKENSNEVLKILKKYNSLATKIGKITVDKDVVIQTVFGKKILGVPSGNIVPRIC